MALPLLLALLAPADPAAALVHAEALARRAVVATPIPDGLDPRPGETMADYATRADGALVPVAGGLARRDRPLLIAPRSVYESLQIQTFPLLGPLGRAFSAMTDADTDRMRRTGMFGPPPGEDEDPRFPFRGGFTIRALPPDDQRTVAGAMSQWMGSEEFGPSDRLHMTPNPQLMVTLPNGRTVGMSIPADGKPYDASPILARYRAQDPDPVPDALRKAVGDRTLPTPATSLPLAEWVRRLGGALPPLGEEGPPRDALRRAPGGEGWGSGKSRLTVDARAAGWRVAVGTPGATLRAVDALRAVARAERLYWRPLGTGWILAASPGDPRPFAIAILHRDAMEAAFPIFERLAAGGMVPRDMLALMIAGEQNPADFGPEDAAAMNRLLAIGKPWGTEVDKGASLAFFANPQYSGAKVKANFSMSISFTHNGGDFGYGVSLP